MRELRSTEVGKLRGQLDDAIRHALVALLKEWATANWLSADESIIEDAVDKLVGGMR